MGSFFSVEAFQSWEDYLIWEIFFNKYLVRTFIELGTGYGGMTTFFALQCLQRGIEFHSFDNQNLVDLNKPIPRVIGLASMIHIVDIFSDAGSNMIAGIIQHSPKPTAIFFDNGDKPREWKIFAPITSPGDFCIVHDWDVEFRPSDVGTVSVDRILTDWSDRQVEAWKSQWFQRK